MKNIRKYIVLSILILMSINIGYAGYNEGTLTFTDTGSSSIGIGGSPAQTYLADPVQTMKLHYKSSDLSGEPISMIYEEVTCNYNGLYVNLPQTVGAPFLIYDGTTEIGNGGMFISKRTEQTSTICDVQLSFYFAEGFIGEDDTIYDLKVYTDPIKTYYTTIWTDKVYEGSHPREYTALHMGINFNDASTYMYSFKSNYVGTTADYTRITTFKNSYDITTTDYISTTNVNRDYTGYDTSSEYVIRYANSSLFYESGYDTVNETYLNLADIGYKYYLKPQINDIEYMIYENIPEPDLTPTLTTDKTNYNLSETIEISYTNINEIAIPGDSYTLYILYPVIDDYKEYEAKFMQHLYSDERDETFTINTSFLSPQNEYYLGISEPGAFHRTTDHIIMSDVFYVYDDNEYLTTSCNPEGNCYAYNGGDISIYYKINNNSDIIIKDNNENIIHTYYDIIDEGEINFYIPDDENKLNSYPNWKFYLNNTEYETNYTTDVTVYWSLITTPTPTPIYTSVPINESVSEQLDELKQESKPIFDLIYGLSELVVDNPDYDDDNIITENEMNNWFNSLIPIVLILLIFIVYTGLSKRR